ncbi:MAG TPA: chromosomal replication initiator protein DnaA [Verrucomicrobiae bacterium]|nr:chromosomal replication initiator protein DnaA [Verrucomicrobiae bacterium]
MHTHAEKVWGAAQHRLQSMLTPEIFKLWFAPVKATELEDNILTLEVPNNFFELWLKDNYLGLLQEVLGKEGGNALKIRFLAREETLAPIPHHPIPWEVEEPDHDDRPREFPLNPRNTFDTFVVGNNNTFAHAAAIAVAQSPGKSYNPLFVYSSVGLGKTHLLHAIGHHVASTRKKTKVVYVSCEKFTNEFIEAIQNNQLVRFRKKYRQNDVFLIDDIQFLAGKERIQEEFFHTFNTLHEAHKQIVMTCDRPASEIQNLEQRLVSRFEWGLVTDMQPPDVETRLAILRKKEKLLGVHLPEPVLMLLAQRVRSNIRRLEGALVRVASYASLMKTPDISIETVEGLLREILHEEGRYSVTIESIQKKVAEHFDLRVADMTGKRRPEHIAFPRQIAMYLARQLTESSFNEIGEAFGGRDHGTVLHACRLVKDRMQVDAQVRHIINFLEKGLLR